MKELSIEEKAKAYDSMFERLKEMYNNNKTNVAARLIYERYFPELKESEDERIRKELVEQKPWSEEDEKQARQIERIVRNDGCTQKLQKQIEDWLKNLNDRVQPKQEWWKEDERYANIVVSALSSPSLEKLYHFNKVNSNDMINWVESLRTHSHWKPSDEQMKALEHFVRSIGESGFASPYDSNTKLIYSLLSDLKKLKA